MREFKDYTSFRKNYDFQMPDLKLEDDKIFFNGELVECSNNKVWEGESFINIGFDSRMSISKVLSNLFPIEFKFRGKKVSSIESVLQGIKYKDKHIQNLVLKYSGVTAYHTRGCNELDFWGNEGKLYWQGKSMNREAEEYQVFLDELYISALKNPLYLRALMATKDKYLLHHIGRGNTRETVLTRYEYESRLNSLREYCKLKNLLKL